MNVFWKIKNFFWFINSKKFKRWEIYRVDFWEKKKYFEMYKSRPVMILNSKRIHWKLYVIVIELQWVKWKIQPWLKYLNPTEENNLTKRTVFNPFNITTVFESQIIEKIWEINEEKFIKNWLPQIFWI